MVLSRWEATVVNGSIRWSIGSKVVASGEAVVATERDAVPATASLSQASNYREGDGVFQKWRVSRNSADRRRETTIEVRFLSWSTRSSVSPNVVDISRT